MKVTRHQTPEAGEVVGIELTCEDFDSEIAYRYSNKCSEGCKEEGLKLFFSPKLRSSTIHANVCSGRWEFVNKLSREWWARKAAEVLGWDESMIREQVDQDWAIKMSNRRTMEKWAKGVGARKSSSAEHTCIGCGKRIPKGYDLCEDCINGNNSGGVDPGSLDDL